LLIAHVHPIVMLLGGFLGGVAWGINARIWMRFVATDPAFTWAGTLFILLGFGIAGLGQAAAYLGRRAGLPRRGMTLLRIGTFATLLPLGVAAGGEVFPTVILAPLAIHHTEWPRALRVVIGLAATVPLVAVAATLVGLPAPRNVIGILWFLAIYAGIVWATGFTLAPQRDGRRLFRRRRAKPAGSSLAAA
jgi:hypothetical protein